MIFDKVKGLLHRKRDEDFAENEEAIETEVNSEELLDSQGDIDFSDEDDPENRAKTLKKKAIMLTGGAILLCAVAAAASNTFFGTKEQADKPLSSHGFANTVTPAEQLPDKYSDIGKYQKNKGSERNDLNTTSNQVGQASATNGAQNTYRATPTATSRPVATTYSSTTATPVAVANYSYRDAAADEAEKAVKVQQAINSSALAFKIAAAVSQGQVPEAAPVSTGASAALKIQSAQATYSFSDDESQDMGSYVLNAGAVIQATLLTGVTSDVPNSDVVAQVRQNIYDSLTGTHLLIPQGSRIIGTAGAAGGLGNQRISVVFKRIILPNGASLTLPNQQAVDGTGYPGLMDKYNEHRGKLYQTAFFSTLFSAAVQSLTGSTSGSESRSPGQEAVSGAVASILQTGQKLMEKDANINPTIEIEPGFQFSVFVNQDLTIGAYHD